MLVLSNRVVTLIGYDGMSADQCDIRQSILRRLGRYEEAEQCIVIALAKNPEKVHTRGLLHVGLAELYKRDGNLFGMMAEMQLARSAAEEAERQDPRQATRIYRHCAELVRHSDLALAEELGRKARVLAAETGAADQRLKMD